MRRTPLYERHVALGGRMVDFAGWEMPIQYEAGIHAEHLAVRTDLGLFDVSHMGEVRVRGPGAAAFLAFATLNDPTRLRPGRAQYSMLPNDRGGLIDDIYVYRDAEDDFLVVCNASNRDGVVAHLRALAEGRDVVVDDESDEHALLALQGPGAAVALERLVDANLTKLRKNRATDARLAGRPVRLARTGYTGEDGFEIFVAPEDAVAVWDALLDAGAVPCGLGARDTLRLEAGFPLYGHELGPDTNPLCTPFAWVVKDKPFHGEAAMRAGGCARRLVGLRLSRRGVAREGYRVLGDGREIGRVTSGTISPLTRDAIAMAWLDADWCGTGTVVAVEIRGQPVPATVASPPFHGS